MVALLTIKCPRCLCWRFHAEAEASCSCEVDLQAKCFMCQGDGKLAVRAASIMDARELRCQVCDGSGLLQCL